MNPSPFLLERHFAKYEFGVPFQLSCSDCEPLMLNELLAMASPESIRLWENLRLSYTESAGHPVLRQEIARFCGISDPEDIIVCVPAEGIFLAMTSLLEPGDQVVVLSPAYQSLFELASGAGCQVDYWKADSDGIFRTASLFPLITNKTRMVVINFPHNPTGSMIPAAELEDIVRYCSERSILLFSDEMYRGLEQDPSLRLPCVSTLANGCISLSGMSKSFALPGVRIGWLSCSDSEIRRKLIGLKDYTSLCGSAPSEVLAIIGLQCHARILDRNLAIIRRNRSLVNQLIERMDGRLQWIEPAAGNLAMLKVNSNIQVEELCRDLLEKKEVLAIGSHLFTMKEPSIRLGLGRQDFGTALTRLEELLHEKY